MRGTALLNGHPLVAEAVITRGPMQLPVGYVIVADEQQPIAAVAAELTRHLERHLATGWQVPLAIVARGPHGRAGLTAVAPA